MQMREVWLQWTGEPWSPYIWGEVSAGPATTSFTLCPREAEGGRCDLAPADALVDLTSGLGGQDRLAIPVPEGLPRSVPPLTEMGQTTLTLFSLTTVMT